METRLTIDQVLDYCDVPQLFTARDAFDTLYLCLLYDDTSECLYTGIRISSTRLAEFMSSKYDLRYLFLHPEQSGEYFDISFHHNEYEKKAYPECRISEERLPAEGYYMKSDTRENVIVNIPANDRSLLKELVRKFGWVCI